MSAIHSITDPRIPVRPPCGCPRADARPASSIAPVAPGARDGDARDGSRQRPFLVRRLTAEDEPLLEQWFDALSPESRRLRFFGPKNRLTEADRRRFLDLDDRCRHSLIATVPGHSREERVVALAGFACDSEHESEAEMAIAVVDSHHGLGIGSTLLRRLGCAAHARGIDTLFAEVLWDNGRMRKLLKHLAPGARGSAAGGGSIRYRVSPLELAGREDCRAAA